MDERGVTPGRNRTGGDATQTSEFRTQRRGLGVEGRGKNRQRELRKVGGIRIQGAGSSMDGRGLSLPHPTPDAESSDSPQTARTRSLLPPERSCGAGRAGADPGYPDAAARARGRGDRRGGEGPAAGAATMEFRQEEFRKLAGRALGRLHR